jgi:hypothetical protein
MVQRVDSHEIRQKTLSISYIDWKKLGFSKGTLYYMKQKAKSDKTFTLKSHVLGREGLGKPGSGVKLTSKEGLSTGILEQMTIKGSRFDASQDSVISSINQFQLSPWTHQSFFKTE